MSRDPQTTPAVLPVDMSDPMLRFCVQILDVEPSCELWAKGYRSEVFAGGNGVTAFRETPQELVNKWMNSGGWPRVKEQPNA